MLNHRQAGGIRQATGGQFSLFLTEYARKQYGSECSINLLILILEYHADSTFQVVTIT
jgi:hypothetical protein